MNSPNDNDHDLINQLGLVISRLPSNVQAIFHYCLCLMMVEAGKMQLVATIPGDSGPLCQFLTTNGETVVIPDPALPPETLEALQPALRQILREETDLLD